MTCAETRELFSARMDDALTPDERAALEAHVSTCTDCAREWQRFAATVGLVRAVEPARAPAGFVDRVLAATRPRPWYERLARGLFVPWPVKLPVQAAAVVLVAGLAVVVVRHSPELEQAARAPVPPPTAVPEQRLATPELAARAAPPDAASTPPPVAGAKEPDARAAREGTTLLDTGRPEPAVPRAAPPADLPAKRSETAREETAGRLAAPASPAAPAARAAEGKGDAANRLQARATADAAVELRLVTADRAAAAREIPALVSRLGGTMLPRRLDAAATLDIVVPREAYPALAAQLARLGTLITVRESAELPASVPVSVTLGE